MAFHDVREFIAQLEKTGDLIRVEEEVDWNLEAGAIMRRCNETESPAPFFQKIKGYPEGYRLLGSPIATLRRYATAMEIDPESTYTEILDVYEERIKNPIKPNLVSDGPCKENIQLGDDINLYKFPTPMVHDGDGGRYIGTFHIVATKDPDSDWVNWGLYRMMIHNKSNMGGLFLPNQHIGRIFYSKYENRGKPMEFAAAFGTEPISTCLAGSPVPYGVSEVDLTGAIRKEPLDVVKCETVDLVVPATSEIVIEGEILPNTRVDEGPFGEYTGFRASPRAPRPVYRVTAITHRNDPILTASCMGTPVDEGDVVMNIPAIWDVRSTLREKGLPVSKICMPPESSGLMCVVSVKTPYANIASQVAFTVWSTKGGMFMPKVIVVNDDIDPTNMKEVIHALSAKLHPVRGILAVPDAVGHPLMPFLNLEERLWGNSSNVLFDCTWPIDWPPEVAVPPLASFRDIYPEKTKKMVLEKWEKYGFKK